MPVISTVRLMLKSDIIPPRTDAIAWEKNTQAHLFPSIPFSVCLHLDCLSQKNMDRQLEGGVVDGFFRTDRWFAILRFGE